MFGNMTALKGLHVTGKCKDRSMQHTCSRHAAWDPHMLLNLQSLSFGFRMAQPEPCKAPIPQHFWANSAGENTLILFITNSTSTQAEILRPR